mmetsp:Transcript_22161/g.44832  ORF Transcript_22161/g.44832 Transcript_22161/m.44832 type:complete len:416 (-) Transcript_22161:120-1367(-)
MTRKRDRWDSSSSEDESDGGGVEGKDKRAGAPPGLPPTEGAQADISSSNNSRVKAVSSDREGENRKFCSDCALPDGVVSPRGLPEDSLPRHNPLLSGCRSVYSCYERLSRLDEGTYGVVWKARDTATEEIVALKQIKFDAAMMKEGFPVTALREISVLLDLSHECIVTVREMVVGDRFDKVFMVMEFMEMDLQEAIKRSGSSPFPQSELKNMMHNILSATAHMHSKWYVHRDMKTSNVLVHRSGKIALCDFGLARKYQMPLRAMTQMVVTLWYRSPELLFGETIYGPEVDMWSIGCIFGELLKKEATIQGRGELDQIDKIFQLLGSPTEERWPNFSKLPNSRTFRWKTDRGSRLGEIFPVNTFTGGQTYLDPNGLKLLGSLLTLDPQRRMTADEALRHPYFQEGVERKKPQFLFN